MRFKYKSLLAKSDHVLIELSILGECDSETSETQRSNKLNYGRVDLKNLREFYRKIGWTELQEARNVQGEYDMFKRVYKEGISKYVPIQRLEDWGTKNGSMKDVRKQE